MASSSAGPACCIASTPYKNDTTIQIVEDVIEFETGNPDAGPLIRGRVTLSDKFQGCNKVVIESIPGIMSSADFCTFLRPGFEMLKNIRLLRSVAEQNRYMAVILVRPERSASDFVSTVVGRPFLQGLLTETCQVRALESYEMYDAGNRDLFDVVDEVDSNCAVCLEPLLSEKSALVTILCNHTMHASCMAQCELSQCPVCRYTHDLKPEASVCMSCSESRDIWMCVVCAYVGCGKYQKQHAFKHFLETQHPFAMNLTELVFWSGERIPPHSVWDYVSERFIDRLLTADDGKVVELGGGGPNSAGASSSNRETCQRGPDAHAPDENNGIALAAAVEESRLYHLISEYQANEKRMRHEHALKVEELEKRLESAEAESRKSKTGRADALRERKSALKRADAAEKEAKELREKNAFLQNLNDTLLQDTERWKKQVNAISTVARSARKERDELKEELRDLMMHLETQATISAANASETTGNCRGNAAGVAELAGAGVVGVGPTPRERLADKLNRRNRNR